MESWNLFEKNCPPKEGKYIVLIESFGGLYYEILNYTSNLININDSKFTEEDGAGFYGYNIETGYYKAYGVRYWTCLPKPPKTTMKVYM